MSDDRSAKDSPIGWPVEMPDGPGTPGTGPEIGADDSDEASDARLDALPDHENDAARGVTDSVGAGVSALGGTAEEPTDSSGQPYPEEDIQKDETGLAGMPPGGPAGRT